MESVFKALSHPIRRRIVDILKGNPGIAVNQLGEHFDVSRIAIHKHLAKLDAAKLVISQQDGRKRRLFFNPVPIQMIYDRWTTELGSYWSSQLTQLKYAVETAEPKDEQ